jgi:hypothetical protein
MGTAPHPEQKAQGHTPRTLLPPGLLSGLGDWHGLAGYLDSTLKQRGRRTQPVMQYAGAAKIPNIPLGREEKQNSNLQNPRTAY